MGAYDLGTASGVIKLDASSLGRASTALRSLGLGLLGIGGLAIVGVGAAVKVAADFEQQMSRFGAVTGTPVKNLEAIRQKALQLGRDSAYGATEVIKAFAELGYAGITAKEILNGVGDATIRLAAAGELPLADAATALVNTLRQFRVPAKGAVQVVDEMARAANASTIDVKDLVTSLRYAGPVAAALNIPFNRVAETLAVLGNEGIRGSTAGTSLRGILIALTPTSAKAATQMKELGLITKEGNNIFFDAHGKLRDMAIVAQILQDHTKGLTDEQKKLAFTTIFQRRAMASALILAREGAKGYVDLANSAQYHTTALQLMNQKLDNFKGSMKILKASIQTFAITAGATLLPVLKSFTDFLIKIVNHLAKMSDTQLKVLISVVALSGGLFILAGAFAFVVGTLVRAYKAFRDLQAGIELVKKAYILLNAEFSLSLIGVIVIAIILLVAAFIYLWTHVSGFRDFWKAVWAQMKVIFDVVWKYLQIAFKWLVNFFTNTLPAALRSSVAFFKTAWKAIQTAMATAWGVMFPILQAIVRFFSNDIVAPISRFVGFVVREFGQFNRYFQKNIMPTIRAFSDLVVQVFKRVQQAVQIWWNLVQPLIRGYAILIRDVFGIVESTIKFEITLLRDFALFMIATFKLIAGLIVAAWQPAWVLIKLVVDVTFLQIKTAFNIFVAAIRAVWGPLWTYVGGFVRNVFATIKAVIDGAFQILRGIFMVFSGIITLNWSKTWEGIKHIFAGVWDVIVALLRGAWNNMMLGIRLGVSVLINFLTTLPRLILNALVAFATLLYNKGDELIRGLYRGILDAWNTIWTWLTSLGGLVVDTVHDLLNSLYDVGAAVMKGLLDGMKSGWKTVTGWLGNLNPANWFNDINVEKGHAAQNLKPMGNAVMAGLRTGMQADWLKTVDWLKSLDPSVFVALNAGVGSSAGLRGVAPQSSSSSVSVNPQVHVVEKGDSVHVEAHQTNADPHEIVDAYFWGKKVRS